MKALNWKILVILGFSLLLLSAGLIVVLSPPRTPELAEVICQPSDLGERYRPFDRPANLTNPYLEEAVVESYTVNLVDLHLTYTSLDCDIFRYVDETIAHQAFQQVCANQTIKIDIQVGDEACAFAGHTPNNLAFRRNEYLVLMNGDIGDVSTFPAGEVDARLQQ